MRTTLDIDDELMRALLARHPDVSKTQAIETAIREYIRADAIARLRAMAGTIDMHDVSYLRKLDRHT